MANLDLDFELAEDDLAAIDGLDTPRRLFPDPATAAFSQMA